MISCEGDVENIPIILVMSLWFLSRLVFQPYMCLESVTFYCAISLAVFSLLLLKCNNLHMFEGFWGIGGNRKPNSPYAFRVREKCHFLQQAEVALFLLLL